MKKVVIIQKNLPHYRVSFYEALSQSLKKRGIDFLLIYGKYHGDDHSLEGEVLERPWMQLVDAHDFRIGNVHFCYQKCFKFLKGADLIIMLQWSSLLINYYLIFLRFFGLLKAKLAFWGHGQNKQIKKNNWRNIFKRFFINQVDWWFVYTQGVKSIVRKNGFSEEKITVVQNAIDTKEMANIKEEITRDEIEAAKEFLGIKNGLVAVYCGKMYEEKRIPFLIQVCSKVRDEVPDFRMIFIGGGEFKEMVSNLAMSEDWVYCIDAVAGKEKLIYFSFSDLLLMPGVVGLVVLDSFVTQTPIVTTNFEFHSPEIEYIKNGENGIITENTVEAYADKVIYLLKNRTEIEKLKKGCEVSSKEYTLDKMVENFTLGIVKGLSL